MEPLAERWPRLDEVQAARVTKLCVLALGLTALSALAAIDLHEPAAAYPICAAGAWRAEGRVRCEPSGEALSAAEALVLGTRIDLNRADAVTLELFAGIGPALAERIVRAREARGGFATWEDVGEVKGIGERRLETLRALGRIEPPSR